MDGAVDHQGEKTYHFMDNDLLTTSYYRLKQIALDEKFTLSRIVSVVPENESLDRFTAFPNPSPDGKVQITLPDKALSMGLHDKKGRILLEQKNPFTKQEIQLPVTGLYLLRIRTIVGEKTIKLIRN